METIKLSEVKKLNEEMFNYFTEANKAIHNTIDKINSCLPLNSNLKTNFFEIYRTDKENFEDNGNTRCKGYQWSAYWAFPLNNIKIKEFYKGSLDGAFSPEAVIFHLDNFDERARDSRISGCKFLTVSFSFGDFYDIAQIFDGTRVHDHTIRLALQNDNHFKFETLNTDTLAKVLLCINRYNEVDEIVNKLGKK